MARVASAKQVTCLCECWVCCDDACNVDSYTISINVHKNNTATRLRAGRVRAESRTEHWQCDRPGFNRHNFSPDGHVLFNVDRAIHYVVPYGRIIRTVHNVNLNLHRSRQGWVAPVFGHRLQLVRLALRPDRVYNKREQKTTALVSRRQGSWQKGEYMVHVAPRRFSFRERREEAPSLSLASAGQSLADAPRPRPSRQRLEGLARARARIMHAPSCRMSHVRWDYWQKKAPRTNCDAWFSNSTRAPGDERRVMDDRRSATCILRVWNIARKGTAGSLAIILA